MLTQHCWHEIDDEVKVIVQSKYFIDRLHLNLSWKWINK